MSKPKKKRQAKRCNRKSATRILTGIQLHWSVLDPLLKDDEVLDSKITHKNPVHRLALREIKPHMQKAINTLQLKWKLSIEVEFEDANGKPYYRAATVVMLGVLQEGNEHFDSAIEDIFAESNMDHYKMTHVVAEICGNKGIRDEDFD